MLLVLSSLSSWAQDSLGSGGYPVLGSLILLENLVPPIPSEVVLPLAGYYVSQGTLDFVPALLAATAGSLIGALIIYAVGRYGGRPALERWGRYVRISNDQIDRADRWFDKRAKLFVLFGRLLPGIRSLVSIPAGLSEMPIASFVGLTLLGSALWNSALIGAGSLLGENWEEVSSVVGDATPIVLGVAVLAGVAAIVWTVRRRRRRAAASG